MLLKKYLRRLIPKSFINLYHGLYSWLAAGRYGFPSKKLVVIGVTGTNGKSTTVNLIAAALSALGEKVALSSTVNFKIGGKEWLNQYKMTMLGRHYLQQFLRDAWRAGCKYAVIENSSEGLAQNRHWGTYYDVAVFTNLTPEHIDSHGSFEKYKAAKKILFDSLNRSWRKNIGGKIIPTAIAANADDVHASYYLNAQADKKITFGLGGSGLGFNHLQATNIKVSLEGVSYKIADHEVRLQLKGHFDVYNSLAALATALVLDVPTSQAIAELAKVEGVPGRLEIIQKRPFMVMVDYAVEPEGMKQLYKTLELWGLKQNSRIIHVLGSTGGGRDVSRRPILGSLAARNADYVIVTNEDPYDDDPQKIIDDVAKGAMSAGKILGEDLFKILDRREAIAKALRLALPGDLVLVTGKGAEQKMAVAGGRYVDWDDRKVIREELTKLT